MQLELAIFEEGALDSCRVRYVESRTEVQAAYAPPVLNRIRIRQGDLVVVDGSNDPPQVVWRWRRGTVERVTGARATVGRRHDGPDAPADEVAIPDWLQGLVNPGDAIFYQHGPDGTTIDVAREGMPMHPARIRSDGYPEIEAVYERMTAS